MHFESLKIFCDVARHRSFSRAAAENEVSQSAASQAVSQLEKRLGVQLINRSIRPLQLTAVGETYYDGCKRLVEQYLEYLKLEASIRHDQQQLGSTVEVAAIYSVGLGDMGKYVEHFAACHPGARVHVEYLHPDRVTEKVLAGTADFGLVSFPRSTRELEALSWREEEMVVACPPGHRFARLNGVRPEQLEGEKYIGFDRGLRIRREVDRFLREQGVNVEVELEFDNIENIKKAIEVGAGVALLPDPTVRREVDSGTLVAVPLLDCRFVRPLGIIQRRSRRPSAAARDFLELLRRPESVNGHDGNATSSGSHTRNGHRAPNGRARSTRKTV